MRRAFLTASLAVLTELLCGPVHSRDRLHRVGVLSFGTAQSAAAHLKVFEQAMAEGGFGKDLTITYAFEDASGLDEAARRLVSRGQDVLLGINPTRVQALRAVAPRTPVVFAFVSDPVKAGLVASLARPGGLVTGVSNQYAEYAGKRLQLARDLLPNARRVALVADFPPLREHDRDFPAALEQVASRLGFSLLHADIVQSGANVRAALDTVALQRPEVVLPYGSLPRDGALEEFQLRARVPVVDHGAGFAVLSYSEDEFDHMRKAAAIIVRILKGAQPGEIPVDRATRYVVAANRKAAEQIGLTLSPSILAAVDRFIE